MITRITYRTDSMTSLRPRLRPRTGLSIISVLWMCIYMYMLCLFSFMICGVSAQSNNNNNNNSINTSKRTTLNPFRVVFGPLNDELYATNDPTFAELLLVRYEIEQILSEYIQNLLPLYSPTTAVLFVAVPRVVGYDRIIIDERNNNNNNNSNGDSGIFAAVTLDGIVYYEESSTIIPSSQQMEPLVTAALTSDAVVPALQLHFPTVQTSTLQHSWNDDVVTSLPTLAPTFLPTSSPTLLPTFAPTSSPTFLPTFSPTTGIPTNSPSLGPTQQPSIRPTTLPPTKSPITSPPITTSTPTNSPEQQIIVSLTSSPTLVPTVLVTTTTTTSTTTTTTTITTSPTTSETSAPPIPDGLISISPTTTPTISPTDSDNSSDIITGINREDSLFLDGNNDDDSPSIATIAGAATGGFLLVGMLVLLVSRTRTRRRQEQQQEGSTREKDYASFILEDEDGKFNNIDGDDDDENNKIHNHLDDLKADSIVASAAAAETMSSSPASKTLPNTSFLTDADNDADNDDRDNSTSINNIDVADDKNASATMKPRNLWKSIFGGLGGASSSTSGKSQEASVSPNVPPQLEMTDGSGNEDNDDEDHMNDLENPVISGSAPVSGDSTGITDADAAAAAAAANIDNDQERGSSAELADIYRGLVHMNSSRHVSSPDSISGGSGSGTASQSGLGDTNTVSGQSMESFEHHQRNPAHWIRKDMLESPDFTGIHNKNNLNMRTGQAWRLPEEDDYDCVLQPTEVSAEALGKASAATSASAPPKASMELDEGDDDNDDDDTLSTTFNQPNTSLRDEIREELTEQAQNFGNNVSSILGAFWGKSKSKSKSKIPSQSTRSSRDRKRSDQRSHVELQNESDEEEEDISFAPKIDWDPDDDTHSDVNDSLFDESVDVFEGLKNTSGISDDISLLEDHRSRSNESYRMQRLRTPPEETRIDRNKKEEEEEEELKEKQNISRLGISPFPHVVSSHDEEEQSV